MGDKNLLLVKSIEKFPCLYNHNSIDYSKKEVTDIAWGEVANETQLTVAECKEKWKNLRYGFIRSLRPNPDGSCKKKYYLHDDMEFVLPFMKLVPRSGSYAPPATVEVDTDEENIEYITENGQSPQYLEYENILQTAEPPRKRTRIIEPLLKNLQQKLSYERANDSRKMFLLSLLPEVNELTEHQMKCFRRKVLALLDDIVDEDNQSSTTNYQNEVVIKNEYA